MAVKRLPRPRDPLSLAKLIGDIATGQVRDAADDERDPAAALRGLWGTSPSRPQGTSHTQYVVLGNLCHLVSSWRAYPVLECSPDATGCRPRMRDIPRRQRGGPC